MRSTADQNFVNTNFSATVQLICSASHSKHFNSHDVTSFTSQLCALLVAYLNQKDERALLGNL